MIHKFNQSPNTYQGRTGSGVDTQKKDSIDLDLSTQTPWQAEVEHVQQGVFKSLIQYARIYPFLLAGPISPTLTHPKTGATKPISHTDVAKLNDVQIEHLLRGIYRLDGINMQHYSQGQGGYHHWHSEQFPQTQKNNQEQLALHRVLLWIVYLNDVNEGGETEFYHQQVSVKPKQGELILAPCGFTHTHRGGIPISNDKYILTSWVMYNNAETLYGA